jgi:restriction system protein
VTDVAEFTQKRYGELSRGVLALLSTEPEGLPAREVLERLAASVPPTDFEQQDWPRWPGVRRYEKTVRFSTIAPVKAGWLVKSAGTWMVTSIGLEALAAYRDPLAFYREAAKRYGAWKKGQPKEPAPEPDEPGEVAFGLEEARESAWEVVRAHLSSLPPYDFQELVGALLRAMGYHVAWIAPPGADGGIDILAYTDPLGALGPRIKVQVKRLDNKVSADGLRSFIGVLGENDIGIFVAAGGFTTAAEAEARREATRKITLINLEKLYQLWIEHQHKVEEAHRQLLPLTPVHYLDLQG